jgi:hypothetical protein
MLEERKKESAPYRRANDMWHVRHLKGLMLVSRKVSRGKAVEGNSYE